jgi:hypothetical protein
MWVGSGYGDWVTPWALWCLLEVCYSFVIVFQISSVPGYLLEGWCVLIPKQTDTTFVVPGRRIKK